MLPWQYPGARNCDLDAYFPRAQCALFAFTHHRVFGVDGKATTLSGQYVDDEGEEAASV